MTRPAVLFVAALALSAPAAAAQCVWGGFDASRLNYADGTLTGPAHGQLRAAIAAQGGALALAGTLTPAWLATIDVFYTSLLDPTTPLAPAEQTALVAWVNGGGTLIVTADNVPVAAYRSVLQPFGFTGLQGGSPGGQAIAGKTAPHALTAGAEYALFVSSGAYSPPVGAQTLLKDAFGAGDAFSTVLDPVPGGAGRLAVFGDHNLFTDELIGFADNRTLARNLVAWACPRCGTTPAGVGTVGAGWPGTGGVPGISSEAAPSVGATVQVHVENSAGQATSGFLLIGASPTIAPTTYGGTIHVAAPPSLVFPVGLPFAGLELVAALPPDPGLCGTAVFLQVLQLDPGASHGVSFTAALRLDLGS